MSWLFPQIAWSIGWARSSIDTSFLPWSPASSVHPASKFLQHCQTSLSLIKISSYTLLIYWWMLAALHPFTWRNRVTASTSHSAGDSIVLGMLTCSLQAQNWWVWHNTINRHTRDTVQHICTKHHLILTVISVSWPTGPWKKIALIYHYKVFCISFQNSDPHFNVHFI